VGVIGLALLLLPVAKYLWSKDIGGKKSLKLSQNSFRSGK